MLLRHILTTQVSASLKRPVTVGDIRFNPYRLKLSLDRLHIGDRDGVKPFVDLGRLRVKVSWTSLWRLAPVVKELEVDRPAVHVVRTGPQAFSILPICWRASRRLRPRRRASQRALRCRISSCTTATCASTTRCSASSIRWHRSNSTFRSSRTCQPIPTYLRAAAAAHDRRRQSVQAGRAGVAVQRGARVGGGAQAGPFQPSAVCRVRAGEAAGQVAGAVPCRLSCRSISHRRRRLR